MKKTEKLTVLITGAAAGIGNAVAKEFLKNTSRSIEEIAYAVGFTSLQRFSDMFKKYVGVSPLTFRKNSQKFPLS